ncbi:MAG TPA: hypothetical protein VM845_09600 [Burkholderiaceae bacterium]|nr:hypothetical protein [Burkholderiaceae bacterium]
MNTLTHAAAHPAATGYRRQSPTLLQAIGRSIWRALEDVGRRRAARELHLLAERRELFDPELARTLRDAATYGMTQEQQP